MKTISTPPPVEPERMHDAVAVLSALVNNPWESRVVLNPAAILVESGDELDTLFLAWKLSSDARKRLRGVGGACAMLYRAQGLVDPAKGVAPSSLGLAIFTPGLEIVHRFDAPVISPVESFHNLGVEDGRCTKVGDTYYLYYTGYASDSPLDAAAERRVRICLATTKDFLHWDLRGPVGGDINDLDNKNPALFPVPVDGSWLMMHRPMSGADAMTIHLAVAPDPAGPWTSRGMLMRSHRYAEFSRSWIGAGGPPIALDENRFVAIYHQGHYSPDGHREYDLAAALLDFNESPVVRARIEPMMRPAEQGERVGDADLGVDNVLFTCACYRWKDDLIIPYAGADSRIFGASVSFVELVAALDRLARRK